MKRMGGYLIIVCLCFIMLLPETSDGDNFQETLIYQANEAYQNGRYQEAVDGYMDLIRMGLVNGHIYYNLGNAYFKNGQPGQAILYYEKARLFLPRDADLNFNLSQCRREIGANEPVSGRPIQDTFFWIDYLTLPEAFWAFALLNTLFWPILLVNFLYKKEVFYYLFLLITACWLMAGATFGLKWYQMSTDSRAVILPSSVDVLAGPFSSDQILFRVHTGTIVFHERSEEGWALIRLTEDKRGWIPLDSMEKILPKSQPKII